MDRIRVWKAESSSEASALMLCTYVSKLRVPATIEAKGKFLEGGKEWSSCDRLACQLAV